jgi:hypothetical protein
MGYFPGTVSEPSEYIRLSGGGSSLERTRLCQHNPLTAKKTGNVRFPDFPVRRFLTINGGILSLFQSVRCSRPAYEAGNDQGNSFAVHNAIRASLRLSQ